MATCGTIVYWWRLVMFRTLSVDTILIIRAFAHKYQLRRSRLRTPSCSTPPRQMAFDVLVTGDKTLQFEQNMQGRKIALVSLSAVSWPVIEPHVAKIVEAVDAGCPWLIPAGRYWQVRQIAAASCWAVAWLKH